MDVIRSELLEGHESNKAIKAELYKLNVYGEARRDGGPLVYLTHISGKGAFFKPHKDTPRSSTMFGSLVIVFPTKHEGGALMLRHGGSEWTFDSATMVRTQVDPSIAYIAFYSDVEHEVTPVTSGYRVTLTYNLYFSTEPTITPHP
jgi:predicted 2-oxoglutarate/Fe(II)-dependent dioxygenase YbiX